MDTPILQAAPQHAHHRPPSLLALGRQLLRLRRRVARLDADQFERLCAGGPLEEELARLEAAVVAAQARDLAELRMKLRLLGRVLREEDLDLAERLVSGLESDCLRLEGTIANN